MKQSIVSRDSGYFSDGDSLSEPSKLPSSVNASLLQARTRLTSTPYDTSSKRSLEAPDISTIKQKKIRRIVSASDIDFSSSALLSPSLVDRKPSYRFKLSDIPKLDFGNDSDSPSDLQSNSQNIKANNELQESTTELNDRDNVLKQSINKAQFLLPMFFEYMNGKELQIVSSVCKVFRQQISQSPRLQRKRQAYLQECKDNYDKIGKENFRVTKLPSETLTILSPRKQFQLIQRSVSPKKSVQRFTLFDSFVVEGQKLAPGEGLQKCAKCFSPARLYPKENKAKCTASSCQYTYCTHCYLGHHQNLNDCPLLQPRSPVSPISLSFKAARKRLRRLL